MLTSRQIFFFFLKPAKESVNMFVSLLAQRQVEKNDTFLSSSSEIGTGIISPQREESGRSRWLQGERKAELQQESE